MSDEQAPPTEPPPHQTGEHTVHQATNVEVKRSAWGAWIAAAISGFIGAGGSVAFLVGFADSMRADARAEATRVDMVTAQRLDVVKGDVDVVKVRLEAVDAGVRGDMRRLEQKIDDATKAQDVKYDRILQELRKR